MKQPILKLMLRYVQLILLVAGCSGNDPAPPSNKTMAFVNMEGGINHIYLMDIGNDGRGIHSSRLTSTSESEDYPSWSPDGSKIAFTRGKDGSGIYIINADGNGLQRLSPIPGYDVTPSWSPDGSKIIYTRVLDPITQNVMPRTEIRIMNLDGSDDHSILGGIGFSVEPRWSVKDKIVFMGFRNGFMNILTMNVDGSDSKQLTDSSNNGDPAWSIDGTKISFGSDREGGDKLNVFTMNADGSEIRQITHFDVPYESGDTSWSCDGVRIAFEWDINGKKQSDPNAYAEVWIVNADGTNPSSTGQRCSGVGCAPRWRPSK